MERYRIEPSADDVARPWMADDAVYFGTVLTIPSSEGRAEDLHGLLSGIEGLTAAADALDEGLMLARLMSTSGVPFHTARAVVSSRLSRL